MNIVWILILSAVGVLLIIYGFVKVLNAPIQLSEPWVKTIFYVFNHEGNVAEMAPIEWLSPKKKNKGQKFYIPESFGRLEPKKTYELFLDKDNNFYVEQVAVMLD